MLKIVLCMCLAVATAIPVHLEEEDHHYAPKYSYKYSVKDYHTDDDKSHWETRDGDKVQGSYRLVEPNGGVRTVQYTADKHNGFQAIVTREKHGHKQVTVYGKGQGGHVEAAAQLGGHSFGGGYQQVQIGGAHHGASYSVHY